MSASKTITIFKNELSSCSFSAFFFPFIVQKGPQIFDFILPDALNCGPQELQAASQQILLWLKWKAVKHRRFLQPSVGYIYTISSQQTSFTLKFLQSHQEAEKLVSNEILVLEPSCLGRIGSETCNCLLSQTPTFFFEGHYLLIIVFPITGIDGFAGCDVIEIRWSWVLLLFFFLTNCRTK